jgi:hypothetical protein
LLNRLPCFSILAEAAAEEVTEAVGLEAAEEVTEAVGLEAAEPEEVTAVLVGRAAPLVVAEVRQVVGGPRAAVARAAEAVSVVEDITRASTVPTHSRGRSFRSFPRVLPITSKCSINSRMARVDLSF